MAYPKMQPVKTDTIATAAPSLDEVAQATAERYGAGRFAPKTATELEALARRWYYSELLPESYYPPLQTERRPKGFPYAARWEERWAQRGISRAVIVMRYGASLGVLPELAIRSIAIVEGQPSPSASLMLGLCIAGGYLRRDDFEVESTAQACTIRLFTRSRPKPESVKVEIAEFRHLLDKTVWKQYPRDMLFARAVSRVARRYFPDVFAGVYSDVERHDMRVERESGLAPLASVDAILEAIGEPLADEPPPIEPTDDVPAAQATSLAEQDALVDKLTKLIAELPADAPPDDPRRAEIERLGAQVHGERRVALAAAYDAKCRKAPSRG